MKKKNNKFLRFIFFFLLPVSLIFVLYISFSTFKKLALSSDRTLKSGKKASDFSREIRNKLLNKKEVQLTNFKTKDGLRLSAYLLKRNNAKSNVLICHGYRSCKEFVSDTADFFPKSNILMFDFRSHGQSEGRLRTLGCHEYKDVIAAAQFLKEKTNKKRQSYKKLPFFIYGFSMGGATALQALHKESNLCDALILDSPFSNLEKVIYNSFTIHSGGLPSYPFVPILIKMLNFTAKCKISNFSPIDIVEKIDKPIFFIHSCSDKIVKPENSIVMYAKACNKLSKIWIGPKCRHCRLRKKYSKKYRKKIDKFTKNVMA